MTRRYDRETKHYFRDVLTHLVETGQGTFYPNPGVYVIKTEDGTVAVRPHQIIDRNRYRPVDMSTFDPRVLIPFGAEGDVTITVTAPEAPTGSPMDGYHGQERYDGEDTGPGGVVYDGAMRLAEEAVATFGGGDPLAYVRRILDDEDGEYAWSLREAIEDHQRSAARPSRLRRFQEQEELLRHFGA